jgi:autoinducer 2-degrading protein
MVVNLEIKADRVDDFLNVIKEDAIGSRTRENGGCYRFDVIRLDDTKFILYECYKDDDAVAFHKAAPHYQLWQDFKKSGGVVSQSVQSGPILFGAEE